MDPDRVFAGVDLSAGRRGPVLAVLTSRLDVRSLKRVTPQEAAENLASFDGIAVAIGSPLRLCREDASPDPSIDPHPQVGRSRHIRSAEKELARRVEELEQLAGDQALTIRALKKTKGWI